MMRRQQAHSSASDILNKIKNDAREVEFYESVKGDVDYHIREFDKALKDPRIGQSVPIKEMAKTQVHKLHDAKGMLEDRIKSEKKEMSDMASLSSAVSVAAKTYNTISSAVGGEFKTKKEFKQERKMQEKAAKERDRRK